jgi:hypothetical protein
MRARFGRDLVMAGDDQRTLELGHLSATPDALVINQPKDLLKNLGVDDIGDGRCVVAECKTIDPRANLVKERDHTHFQVQVQVGLIRALTEYKPEYAVISYIDASFWDEIDEFVVRFDEGIFSAAEARANKILATDHNELKPEGWIAGGAECEYCPFTLACGVIRKSLPEHEAAADPQFAAEIADMCRDLQDAKMDADRVDAEIREKQQEIKDRMRSKSVRKIPGIVTWSTVKGRDSYDMKSIRIAAKAAGINIDQFCQTGEPTDRLQISVGRIAD